MESGSQSSDPTDHTSQKLASFIGTLIALLTLAAPIISIAHFPSTRYDQILQSPQQLLPQPNDLD
ncbi:hypothetical protein [Thermocoleostomius sinensis]|uniref:Uncharacterized protein n=1 Tax=Thermocoleostomius sinensis A174 TaxID=2016057 RepID=A0A9E9C6H0_9CYAN|nr:hypothetical protein [Thermocoleostomius sinensis]WAL58173.1 hypothetical protein OXH18_13335 [Thermocoleostomius sinensis A174]